MDGGYWAPPECILIDNAKVNGIVAPAGLQVGFRVLDCDGNPVRPLVDDDVVIINDEKNEAFVDSSEGASASGIGLPSALELYSVLALDLSDSVVPSANDVIDAAEAFVSAVVTEAESRLKHRVAIYAFGSTANTELIQDFTNDATVLNARLEALRTAPGRGTTNLYGAYITALEHLAEQGSPDAVIEKFLVVMTDGTHEAGNVDELRSQALYAKQLSGATIYSIGVQGDYDSCRLEELAGSALGSNRGGGCRQGNACSPDVPTPPTCTQYVTVENAGLLTGAFQELSERAAGVARSNYVVGVCTPVELGTPTLTINVDVDGASDSSTLNYDTTALTGELASCQASDIAVGQLVCDSYGICEVACLNMECGSDLGLTCGTCGGLDYCFEGLCLTACEGMTCGTDNGISCGSCTTSQYCDGDNVCKTPCINMDCGMDHGFACGTCTEPDYCDTSVNQCLTACEGMTCGTDQGISCGTCDVTEYCDTDNVCKTICDGMDCGTDRGVSCGTCAGTDYCDTSVNQCTPACVNLDCGRNNGVSCGSCGGMQYCDKSAELCTTCAGAADAGACEEVCLPDDGDAGGVCTDLCVDMNCGTDQGVSCGSCSGIDYCDVDNVCKTPCDGLECGYDRGFACGVCVDGEYCDDSNTCADGCAVNPCANGGTCTPENNGYSCACAGGFAGEDCAYATNFCNGNYTYATAVGQGCTTITGDLTISSTSATDLAGLESISVIGGNLVISSNSQLTSLAGLDGLTQVSGNLTISSNGVLTSLNGLQNLDSVGGSMTVQSNNQMTQAIGMRVGVGTNLSISGNQLQVIEFTDLSALGGNLQISGTPALMTADFPALLDVGNIQLLSGATDVAFNLANVGDSSALQIQGVNGSVDLSGLLTATSVSVQTSDVDLDLSQLGSATTVSVTSSSGILDLSGLVTATSLSITSTDALVDFGALEDLSGDLLIGTTSAGAVPATVSLPLLASIGGSLRVRNATGLTSFSAAILTTVGGLLEFTASAMGSIDLPELASVGSGASFQNNTQLLTLTAPKLDDLGSGALTISNNALLNTVDLSLVTSFVDGVTISNNPNLSSLMLDELLDSVTINLSGNSAMTSFGAPKLALVTGNATFDDNFSNTNMAGLGALAQVTGTLYIRNNVSLQSLSGISGLTTLGANPVIQTNPKLLNCEAQAFATAATTVCTCSGNMAGTCP